eukprot:482268-Pelagomonas_calceolata.AAC.1
MVAIETKACQLQPWVITLKPATSMPQAQQKVSKQNGLDVLPFYHLLCRHSIMCANSIQPISAKCQKGRIGLQALTSSTFCKHPYSHEHIE